MAVICMVIKNSAWLATFKKFQNIATVTRFWFEFITFHLSIDISVNEFFSVYPSDTILLKQTNEEPKRDKMKKKYEQTKETRGVLFDSL